MKTLIQSTKQTKKVEAKKETFIASYSTNSLVAEAQREAAHLAA